MKSILLIVPYFGKMKNYVNLFLRSCAYNHTVDFLFITDAEISLLYKPDNQLFNGGGNIKVIKTTFESFKSVVMPPC